MEKYIIRVSYWLGLVCALLALVIRGLSLIGVARAGALVHDNWHMLFYKGAVLLFLTAIATYAYAPQQK